MIFEIVLAFCVIALAGAGLGIGLLLGRGGPRGTCATAMSNDGGYCAICGVQRKHGSDEH